MKTTSKIFFIIPVLFLSACTTQTRYCDKLADLKESSKETIEMIAFEITQHEQFNFDKAQTEYCINSDNRVTVSYTHGKEKLEAIIDTLSIEYLIVKK